MFKRHYVYPTSKDARLDTIINQIPSNAFIDKGKCGIGGTTLEILDKSRSSIIVAPTVSILLSKGAQHSELFIIWERVTEADIEAELLKGKTVSKLMTTPEGLVKLIHVAKKIGVYEQMQASWFLLLDECHCFVTEEFRENILAPFRYFWTFKHKAVISATPYEFSDTRFSELDYHEVRVKESLGKVKLVDCLNPKATLKNIMDRRHEFPGSIFIFFNSVTAIVSLLEDYEYTDVSIYCADDKERSNLTKLGELEKFYHPMPNDGNYSKLNFLTGRYFEGWDLNADQASIILVTDIHSPHTMVPVNLKLKQAAGRLRGKLVDLIHLTNHRNISSKPLSIHDYKMSCIEEAQILIDIQRDYIDRCLAKQIQPKEDSRLTKYVDGGSNITTLEVNPYKLDQQIYIAYNDHVYNHIDYIANEWRSANFKVELQNDLTRKETQTKMNRKSKATQLKEDIQAIMDYRRLLHEGTVQFINVEDQIRKTNKLAYEAANLIDIAKLAEMKFNVKQVERAVIIASNLRSEGKLMTLVSKIFSVGQRYSISYIIKELQRIYDELDIRDIKKGTVIKAEAKQLEDNKWFAVKQCKMSDHKTNGYIMVARYFTLQLAA